MNLRTYLDKTKTSPSDFAKAGGFSIFAVRKWLYGERIPRDHNKLKIFKMTEGKVRAKDWVGGLK